MSATDSCNGYFKVCDALLNEPFNAVTWVRSAAAQSWATIFFGHLFTDICYLILAPIYLALFFTLGLLNIAAFPFIVTLYCMKKEVDREGTVFSKPCMDALFAFAAVMTAIICCTVPEPRNDNGS